MPRFCANLTMMFTEHPLLERFARSKAQGFDAVEVLFPYEDAPKLLVREILAQDQALVLINCPPPNYTGGTPGYAAVPELQERFRRDFIRTLEYAKQLKPLHIHIMAGVANGPVARAVFVENLIWATQKNPDQSLTIEPINQTTMPGYFLSDFDEAASIIEDVNAPNLGLQFDGFHSQMTNGNVVETFDRHQNIIRHVQVGSAPDRHEPDAGLIDYPAFFKHLDSVGYDGFVSGEYNPLGRTEDGLAWIR